MMMRLRDHESSARGLAAVERIYRVWGQHPRLYAAQDLVTFLGRHRHIRRRAVEASGVGLGGRVLEVACGTGRNFPYIQDRIGPTGTHVEMILTRVCERVGRLLQRRTQAAEGEDDPEPDLEQQLLLQCASVAPSERITVEGSDDLGPKSPKGPKGRKSRRRKHLCVRSPEGLELHADVHVKTADRAGLERLCKYLARPAIPGQRLTELPDGRIEFRLKRTWKGGVRALVYEPLALIARLVALIPRPGTHMRRFYGVFAPNHKLRSRVVPRPPSAEQTGRPVAPKRPATMLWAELLKRTFNINALRCPHCAGLLWVVSIIRAPSAIQAIVAAVHLADTRAAEQRAGAAPRGPP